MRPPWVVLALLLALAPPASAQLPDLRVPATLTLEVDAPQGPIPGEGARLRYVVTYELAMPASGTVEVGLGESFEQDSAEWFASADPLYVVFDLTPAAGRTYRAEGYFFVSPTSTRSTSPSPLAFEARTHGNEYAQGGAATATLELAAAWAPALREDSFSSDAFVPVPAGSARATRLVTNVGNAPVTIAAEVVAAPAGCAASPVNDPRAVSPGESVTVEVRLSCESGWREHGRLEVRLVQGLASDPAQTAPGPTLEWTVWPTDAVGGSTPALYVRSGGSSAAGGAYGLVLLLFAVLSLLGAAIAAAAGRHARKKR